MSFIDNDHAYAMGSGTVLEYAPMKEEINEI